jgi:hypothetical protein
MIQVLIFFCGVGIGVIGTVAVSILRDSADPVPATRRQIERARRRNTPALHDLPFRSQGDSTWAPSVPPPMDDFDRLETEDV